jgi:hypothetical protein
VCVKHALAACLVVRMSSNLSPCRTPRLGGSLLAKFAKARQKARARAENSNSNTAPERERAGTSPNQRKNQRHRKSTELRGSEIVRYGVREYCLSCSSFTPPSSTLNSRSPYSPSPLASLSSE